VIGRKDFSKIDEVLDAALSRPATERLRFVEEACAGDAGLAEEVRKLLELSDRQDSLFPSGALKGPLWDEIARELQNGGDDPDLQPGSYVGPYEIVGFLGRGGMGTVYRATDPGLGREVAIKALTHELAIDGSTMRRFEREAKLLASLNHPNIASIYDLLDIDEKRYLVLELVEGETLAELLARGPLEIAQLLKIAEQIAEALGEVKASSIAT
jgi:serine/threonine protein kinase